MEGATLQPHMGLRAEPEVGVLWENKVEVREELLARSVLITCTLQDTKI